MISEYWTIGPVLDHSERVIIDDEARAWKVWRALKKRPVLLAISLERVSVETGAHVSVEPCDVIKGASLASIRLALRMRPRVTMRLVYAGEAPR